MALSGPFQGHFNPWWGPFTLAPPPVGGFGVVCAGSDGEPCRQAHTMNNALEFQNRTVTTVDTDVSKIQRLRRHLEPKCAGTACWCQLPLQEWRTVVHCAALQWAWCCHVYSTKIKRNSSGDEIANVNFLYDDIVHVLQNTIDSCIKFRHRSTRLCVGTHVYQIQWNNAI